MTSLPMPLDATASMPTQMRGIAMAAGQTPAGAPPGLDGTQLPAGFREFLLANLQALQGGRLPTGERGTELPLQVDEAASPEVLEAYLKAAGVELLPEDGKVLPPGMVLSKLLQGETSVEGEGVDGEPAADMQALLALLTGTTEDGEDEARPHALLQQLLRRTDGEGGAAVLPAALQRAMAQTQGGNAQTQTEPSALDAARPLETASAAAGPRPETAGAPRPAVPLGVDVPMGRPGWDQAVGGRVLWMLNNDTQAAQIKLNPPHLGPLDVRVNVEGDKAHITFTAQHAPVREALDAAIPRLREMLAENGLSLGDVNVSQHGPGGSGQGGQARGEVGTGLSDDAAASDAGDEGQAVAAPVVGEGLIDYYA